jgi:hypothetical protein
MGASQRLNIVVEDRIFLLVRKIARAFGASGYSNEKEGKLGFPKE